jgi:CBS domain-containing protein
LAAQALALDGMGSGEFIETVFVAIGTFLVFRSPAGQRKDSMAVRDKRRRTGGGGGAAPTVIELMQQPSFRIRSDMRVGVTWALFIEKALAMATVVDSKGHPVGTLWRGDLAAAVLDDEPTAPGVSAARADNDDQHWPFRRSPPVSELSLVADIMRAGGPMIASGASVDEARAVLRDSSAAELVVVDPAGAMLGILVARDLLAGADSGGPESVAQLRTRTGLGHAPRR